MTIRLTALIICDFIHGVSTMHYIVFMFFPYFQTTIYPCESIQDYTQLIPFHGGFRGYQPAIMSMKKLNINSPLGYTGMSEDCKTNRHDSDSCERHSLR